MFHMDDMLRSIWRLIPSMCGPLHSPASNASFKLSPQGDGLSFCRALRATTDHTHCLQVGSASLVVKIDTVLFVNQNNSIRLTSTPQDAFSDSRQ